MSTRLAMICKIFPGDDPLVDVLTALFTDEKIDDRLRSIVEGNPLFDGNKRLALHSSLTLFEEIWWLAVGSIIEDLVSQEKIPLALQARIMFALQSKQGYSLGAEPQPDGTYEIWLERHTDENAHHEKSGDACSRCPKRDSCPAKLLNDRAKNSGAVIFSVPGTDVEQ